MQWSNEWLRTLPRMLTYIIKKEQKVQGLFTLFLNFFLFFSNPRNHRHHPRSYHHSYSHNYNCC